MSTTPSQPDASETDDLVAYLDGELSADECRRVERRLAHDEDYRRRLTELERAWTALDSLPSTVVDDDFARTTIEMVCVAADSDLKQSVATRSSEARRRRWWMAAGGALIALAAFAATWRFAPSRDRILLADLPVVVQVDVLDDVGDVAFLRGLTKLDLEDSVARGTSDDSPALTPAGLDWETFADRRAWVESLSTSEKSELEGKLDRYERESPAARERILQLAREIEAADDRRELEATLSAYGAWLQTRSPAERAGLRGLAVDERLARVEKLLEQSQRLSRRQLSPDDEKALQLAILSLVEQRRHELPKELLERVDRRSGERSGERSTAFLAFAIIGLDSRDDHRREQLESRLIAPLSDEAQAILDRLDGRRRRQQLGRWVFEALAPKVRPQSLQEFFVNSLSDDQREYLLGLPRADMDEQLRQMHARSRVGLHDDDIPRGFGWGWPGDRRGGRDGRVRRDDRDGRGPRDRPRGEFEGDRFDGPPGRRGPDGGPPPGRPPGPPPRDGQWRPPRDREPPPGPPPEEHGGPPEEWPPRDEENP